MEVEYNTSRKNNVNEKIKGLISKEWITKSITALEQLWIWYIADLNSCGFKQYLFSLQFQGSLNETNVIHNSQQIKKGCINYSIAIINKKNYIDIKLEEDLKSGIFSIIEKV